VTILPGKGDGTFGPTVRFEVGERPAALAVADFNGDGIPDLAVANSWSSSISILIGTGGPSMFRAPTSDRPQSRWTLTGPEAGGQGASR
jgi:hypothetical protein